MREIKFRYLITGNNKIPVMREFTLVDLSMGIMVDHLKNARDIKYCGEFTGLKDKNGQEIWEGDIVSLIRCPEGCFACSCKKVPDKEFTDVVIFENGAFIARELEHEISDYEIIGNIYKDPELLKEEPNNNKEEK